MTHDTTGFEDTLTLDDSITDGSITDGSAPPLCLVHYFSERTESPPERGQIQTRKPPGSRGRVIARDGNLIILEFAEPPKTAKPIIVRRKRWQGKRSGQSLMGRVFDTLMLLLLLASFIGCLAAFR